MKDWKKIGVLAVLLAVWAAILLREGSAPGLAGLTPAPERRSAAKGARKIPDEVLRVERLETAARVDVGELRRNIFEYGSRPAPEPPPTAAEPAAPPPVAAPQPPVRFYGLASNSRSGQRQALLTDGEEVIVASQGELILGRYRLLRVGDANVEIEEVGGRNYRWVVPLEQP